MNKYLKNLSIEDLNHMSCLIFGYDDGGFFSKYKRVKFLFYKNKNGEYMFNDYNVYFLSEESLEENIYNNKKYRNFMLEKFGMEYAKDLINNL